MNKCLAPLAALLLAGCATQVPQALPPPLVLKTFTGPVSADAKIWPEPAWWQGFGDPHLTALIEQARLVSERLGAPSTNQRGAA